MNPIEDLSKTVSEGRKGPRRKADSTLARLGRETAAHADNIKPKDYAMGDVTLHSLAAAVRGPKGMRPSKIVRHVKRHHKATFNYATGK